MTFRSGTYIVPTDQWYIERAVWGIAGIVLLTATALALWVTPYAALLITATGLSSIVVALTGFCVVGNVLYRIGFVPRLAAPAGTRPRWYRMATDTWYLERRIYLVVGINISVASILSIVWTPWFLAFTGFVGGAMLWFPATGYCIMANALYLLGAEPRLAPEAGNARACPAGELVRTR